jgi:predicted branched-subunit amino acid permease
VRAGAPFAVAGGLLAMSFGVLADSAGLSAPATIVMSAIVYAGSAQFAAIAIVAGGGGVGAALAAAALMNSRFLAMGAALGPSLPGNAAARAAQGQTVVDASWVLASRGDGTFDRNLLFGSSAIQYSTWVSGTTIGALGGDLLGDPERLGLDAIYPAFFLALLVSEARGGRPLGVAALGAAIALALVPVAPAGVPVLVASLAVGPIALGGRELPGWFSSLVALLAPALLAALVVTAALADGDRLAVGPDTAGVAAGGLVAFKTGSIIACVVVAAALTAGLRAL